MYCYQKGNINDWFGFKCALVLLDISYNILYSNFNNLLLKINRIRNKRSSF